MLIKGLANLMSGLAKKMKKIENLMTIDQVNEGIGQE